MKFHYDPVPPDPTFQPDDDWQPLANDICLSDHDCNENICVRFAPLMALLAVTMLVLWYPLLPDSYWGRLLSLLELLMILLILFPLHELIHALVLPQADLSNRTIFGFWLRQGMFYVSYCGEMSRNRVLICLLMSFLLLSIAPIMWTLTTGYFFDWFIPLSIFNVVGSTVDIASTRVLLRHAPAGAIVRNNGDQTFWRLKIT